MVRTVVDFKKTKPNSYLRKLFIQISKNYCIRGKWMQGLKIQTGTQFKYIGIGHIVKDAKAGTV